MEKFDLSKSKYYIFVIFLILIFIACIAQAFNYLPDKNNDTIINSSVNLPAEEDISVKTDANENETAENSRKRDNVDEDFDIDTPPAVSDERISDTKKYRDEDYKKLERIEDAESISASEQQRVEPQEDTYTSYRNKAIAYAKERRYGTALAYAQKAYNMNPTTEGEVLLARLYYKTGDYTKANDRMNNVLKRDFAVDR